MVDIRLRELALTKAGYEVVPCENPKGYHLRLPDGTYLSEHWTGLPDWFKTEELAWRAAPAVEVDLNAAYDVLLSKAPALRARWICEEYTMELEAVR